jgi:hypothetical protein
VGAFMVPAPPHVDASTAKIASFVSAHRHALLASGVVNVVGVVAFLWFVGHLRHVLERAEGGAEALSPIVMVSGTVLAATAVAAAIPGTLLAFMAGGPGGLTDGPTVRMLFDMMQVMGGILGVVAAPFMLAVGYAMVRQELVAPWLGWLAVGVSIVDIGSGIMGMTLATYSSAATAFGYVGLLGFAAVVLIASVSMEWRPEAERERSHEPVFAHS